MGARGSLACAGVLARMGGSDDANDIKDLQHAAQHAVQRHPLVLESLVPKLNGEEESVGWKELAGNSRNWMPLSAMERQGNPSRSMLAFHAAYELKGKIGTGGCAAVHRAVRRKTGRSVAVKMLRAGHQMSEADVKAEADLMRSLDHFNVIRT